MTPPLPRIPKSSQRAFTLIELLVAMAVLALLVVVVAQLGGITTRSVTDGLRRADHFAKGRAAVDLFLRDLNDGVFRKDLAAFRDASGNPSPAFFVRRPGIGGDRALSLVVYRTDPAEATLLRGSLPVRWDDAGTLTFGIADRLPAVSSLAAGDFQPVASGVVQMEVFFLNADGTHSDQFTSGTRAVGVAMVVLDEAAFDAAVAGNTLKTLRNTFSRQTQANPENYESFWQRTLDGLVGDTRFPEPVLRGIRIFQRISPISE
jgi:prepilin-type N-terminal cleavage/methylation domain-containing protein